MQQGLNANPTEINSDKPETQLTITSHKSSTSKQEAVQSTRCIECTHQAINSINHQSIVRGRRGSQKCIQGAPCRANTMVQLSSTDSNSGKNTTNTKGSRASSNLRRLNPAESQSKILWTCNIIYDQSNENVLESRGITTNTSELKLI